MKTADPASVPFRWPLPGMAALLVVLIAALTLLWAGTGPADAPDDYEPDQQLVD